MKRELWYARIIDVVHIDDQIGLKYWLILRSKLTC